ncbi:hypothetical protein ACS0TY_027646 [Phlomoides rotata]
MFVFGSSLVDNGNNNFLLNPLTKADFSPYGADFRLGPSGRFTNGRNIVDILGQHLKIPNFIPPFTHPSTLGTNICMVLTLLQVVLGVISLNQQITRILSDEYLFLVGTGGNDYSLNYFLGLANRTACLEDFTTMLIANLTQQLKMLYDLGARKFVLNAINPNGCSPMATTRLPKREGFEENLNRAAHLYNANLRDLVLKIKCENWYESPCIDPQSSEFSRYALHLVEMYALNMLIAN